jgi:hypothetical protein
MHINKILMQELVSKETSQQIGWCLAAVIWVVMLFTILHEKVVSGGILAYCLLIQLAVTLAIMEYTKYSLKKEIIEKINDLRFDLRVQEEVQKSLRNNKDIK